MFSPEINEVQSYANNILLTTLWQESMKKRIFLKYVVSLKLIFLHLMRKSYQESPSEFLTDEAVHTNTVESFLALQKAFVLCMSVWLFEPSNFHVDFICTNPVI